MAGKVKQKGKLSKQATARKTTKSKVGQKRVSTKSVAKKTRVKKPQVKQRLVVGGTFVDLEWGDLDAAVARRILRDGIAETDAWALMTSSESGLTDDYFVTLDDEPLEIEIGPRRGTLTKTRIGKPKRWTIVKVESGDGEVYTADIAGSFEENKLSFSCERLSNGLMAYTLVEPSYNGVFFDAGDISTTSQSWHLIDPEGQEHEFELLDE
jgi:hypothetical protein